MNVDEVNLFSTLDLVDAMETVNIMDALETASPEGSPDDGNDLEEDDEVPPTRLTKAQQ